MASGKDLTRLATLAGMAYIANKMGDKDKGDSGSTRAARPESTETRAAPEAPTADEGTKSKVLEAITAKREAPNDQASNQGVIDESKIDESKLTPVKPKPRSKRTVMTGAQNDALANAGKKSKAAFENTALAKVNRGMGREVTEAAKVNAAPAPTTSSKVGDAATQGPAASTAPANKFEHEMPIARFFKNVREAGNRGNPDVKMASGGMTASRRGDGIAQRGKTRGKMC